MKWWLLPSVFFMAMIWIAVVGLAWKLSGQTATPAASPGEALPEVEPFPEPIPKPWADGAAMRAASRLRKHLPDVHLQEQDGVVWAWSEELASLMLLDDGTMRMWVRRGNWGLEQRAVFAMIMACQTQELPRQRTYMELLETFTPSVPFHMSSEYPDLDRQMIMLIVTEEQGGVICATCTSRMRFNENNPIEGAGAPHLHIEGRDAILQEARVRWPRGVALINAAIDDVALMGTLGHGYSYTNASGGGL